MPYTMSRGKNQVLYGLLPERTVDFGRGVAIARIVSLDGIVPGEISKEAVIRRIASEVRAWREEWRPALRNTTLADPSRFELVDPETARCDLFPLVFWCRNPGCERVLDYTDAGRLPPRTCPECGTGQLVQLRFVRIHKCGALLPLRPPSCSCGAGNNRMALDTRESLRIRDFRWVCRQCRRAQQIFPGYCSICSSLPREERIMEVQLHRAGKTYYPYYTTLLNIPQADMQSLLSRPEMAWTMAVAAKLLGIPEAQDRSLLDLAGRPDQERVGQQQTVPVDVLAELTEKFQQGEMTAQEMAERLAVITDEAQERVLANPCEQISQAVVERTGLCVEAWREANYELLESLMPTETLTTQDVYDLPENDIGRRLAGRLGLAELRLLSDFPITTATYGYSRSECGPNAARLNPFPPDRRRGGRLPIYVQKVQADALRIRLAPDCVLDWMRANGLSPTVPSGSDHALAQQAYFIGIFTDAELRATLPANEAEVRAVFCLLHTFSHLCLKQAALLAGLERTSLSEYILPRRLEFILYANHRQNATIGALTALFEQAVPEWLRAVGDSRRCVYDPVCAEKGGNCHACTHLAETSCRFFNLNLSRSFLFGSNDQILGNIANGYFDFVRDRYTGAPEG